MAAQRPHVNFQAQVESVLGELVKVATLELTKLFESRYQAVAGSIVQPERWTTQNKSLEYLDKTDGKLRRSIGIQVNENATQGRSDCSQQCWEEEDVTMEHARLAKDEEQVDPAFLALGKNDVIRVVVSRNLETEPPASSWPESDVHKQDSTRGPSQPRTPNRGVDEEEKPLIKLEDESDEVGPAAPGPTADVEFPKPQSKEEGVQADPRQPIVSIAKGTAYSPSPLDGAVGVLQVKVWERIRTARETDSHLHLKLKLPSPDQKLMSPCSVQLVNLLAVSEAERADVPSAGKACSPVPRDLRHHQGVHTGHRLCCFTRCESGVWRLQRVVARSRDGYPCDMCGKKFKRRKVLRRHERFHSGEKPYACSHCRKSFALRKSLRRHERFHTDERPHTCAQCGKSFRLRENLKAHLRFHTGEKPFVCPTCGKKFRILRNLEKHSLSQCGFPVPSFRTIAGL